MKKNKIQYSNMLAILNFIKEHENNTDSGKGWRKATEMDILGKITNTQGVLIDNLRLSTNKKVIKKTKKNGDKVDSFRMQEEFGPKKRIKP